MNISTAPYGVYQIAAGNDTALVYCGLASSKLAHQFLQISEQVGLVSCQPYTLRMMGGELCLNACLAFAFALGGSGTFRLNSRQTVSYSNRGDLATIVIRLRALRPDPSIVLLDDIGYIVEERTKVSKDDLVALAREYKLPAFGHLNIDGNAITPSVYVRDVDTFVAESACGSGSVAAAIATGATLIRQPSGGVIAAQYKEGEAKLRARVTVVRDAGLQQALLSAAPTKLVS